MDFDLETRVIDGVLCQCPLRCLGGQRIATALICTEAAAFKSKEKYCH